MTSLSTILTAAREKAEYPAFDKIARQLERDYAVVVTGQAITNYHNGTVGKPNVEIVSALVDYYGLALTELPPELRIRCEATSRRVAQAKQRRRGRRKYAPRDSNPEPADSDNGANPGRIRTPAPAAA